MESVTNLCPKLERFHLATELLCPILLEQEARFAQLFSSLNNLTELVLQWCCPSSSSDCFQFFTHLGDSCPQLKNLTLGGGWKFEAEQLLFLTLGKNAEALSPLVKQQILVCGMHRVQFDDQYTTAITKSLKDLTTYSLGDNRGQRGSFQYGAQPLSFLLRHFLKLESLQFVPQNFFPPNPACLVEALGLLQDALDNANHQLIHQLIVPAVNNFNDPPRLKWTLYAPPPCKLTIKF